MRTYGAPYEQTFPLNLVASKPSLLDDDGCSDWDEQELFPTLAVDPLKAPVLFDDQEETLSELRHSVRTGHTRPMVQAATGSGKTVLTVALTRDAYAKWEKRDPEERPAKALIFIVPKKDLVSQTAKRFREGGVNDVGMLGDGFKRDLDAPVLVTTWQSLKNRPELMDTVIAVIDEAHKLPEFIKRWMKEAKDVLFIGLSATPDAPGLGKYFDDHVKGGTVEELTEKGRLSPWRCFYGKVQPDMTGVRTLKGEWHEGQTTERVTNKELVADIVQNWLEHGENRPTVCFCLNRVHAKELRLAFDDAGVRTGYIDYKTDGDERKAVEEKSKSGKIQVVLNVRCLVEGSDWPWLSCGILAAPYKQARTYTQIVGRFLRTTAGKDDAVLFDHSTSTARFIDEGMVRSIYKLDFDFSLDSGADKSKGCAARKKYEAKEAKEEPCPRCGFLKPAGVRRCPECKFEALPPSGVVVLPGKLTEVGGSSSKKARATRAEKQSWYGQLVFLASSHGYKDGWISRKYKEKFGVWPRGLSGTPVVPTIEVKNWVKSRQIAWAKSRKEAA